MKDKALSVLVNVESTLVEIVSQTLNCYKALAKNAFTAVKMLVDSEATRRTVEVVVRRSCPKKSLQHGSGTATSKCARSVR